MVLVYMRIPDFEGKSRGKFDRTIKYSIESCKKIQF